jgi:hypothetical protein
MRDGRERNCHIQEIIFLDSGVAGAPSSDQFADIGESYWK